MIARSYENELSSERSKRSYIASSSEKGYKMLKYLLILAVGMVAFSVIFYLIKNHIHIDFKSLFKKGFKKLDDDFGVQCFTR